MLPLTKKKKKKTKKTKEKYNIISLYIVKVPLKDNRNLGDIRYLNLFVINV